MNQRLLLILLGLTLFISLNIQPVLADGGTLYTVQSGDTFYSIAASYGITTDELLAANQLGWNSWISAGQQLIIPAQEPAPVIPAAPALETPLEPDTPVFIEPTFAEPTQSAAPPNSVDQPSFNYLLTPVESPAQASTTTTPGKRWIDVDLTMQTLTAYEDHIPIFTARVSTGTWKTPTIVGTFPIYVKYEKARMSGGFGADAYDLPNVPYVMYFYKGYGLHGTYWHNNFGTPMSHGCVNLSTEDAKWLFEWASIGTEVVTHY
jgi:lipoprotein-anchoring transpeptidase ErfK/SrfK